MLKKQWALLGLLFILGACGKSNPQHSNDEIEIDSTGVEITFSEIDDFEIGQFEDGSSLSIENGQYLIQTTNKEGSRYLFGKSNTIDLKNIVIEVEAALKSGDEDNWFGVMCRVDDAGTGYSFLISADGFWAIARSNGHNLEFIENWRESDKIKKGYAKNTLRVYCINDYLALYVNGDFLGDHTDKTYNQVGDVGLLAGGAKSNENTVSFDNLSIKPAYLKGQPNTATIAVPSDTPEAIATLDFTAPMSPTLDTSSPFQPLATEAQRFGG